MPPSYAQQQQTIRPTVLGSSGPVVLKSNTVYSGLRIANPNGNCLEIRRGSNIVLKDSVIGPCKGKGLHIYRSSDIKVENNVFHDVATGVFALYTTGNIRIVSNKFSNVIQVNKTQTESAEGHYIQFAHVAGTGHKIESNVGESIEGISDPAEGINIFRSNGTSSNPIEVTNNSIRGGGYKPNAPGTSSSGGILAGDGGGSHIHVKNNTVVSTGVHGITIAGGKNHKILNNSMYSPQSPLSFAGLQVRLWQNPILPQVSCSGHEAQGNRINWTSHWGSQTTEKFTEKCGTVIGWENNDTSATFNEGILPDQLIEPLLKAHYPFNGSTEDKGGHSINGVATNATYVSSGVDKAIRFNGADSSIKVPSSGFLKFSPFSVTAWIKPDAVAGEIGIAKSQDGDGYATGWRIVANHSKLGARITTRNYSRKWDGASPPVSTDVNCDGLVAGSWNFIVVTYSGKNLQCYLNGVLGDSKTASGIIQYGAKTSDMKIGESSGKSPFQGAIDEFKVFRGSLSSAQVRNTYESVTKNILNNPPRKEDTQPSPPIPPSIKVEAARAEGSVSISQLVFDQAG